MPSLPAVMNELMSYTETPMRVAPPSPPDAESSPAPHAASPSPSAAAEAMANIFVPSFICLLSHFLSVGCVATRGASCSSFRGPHVDRHRGDDQHTLDDVLPVGGHHEDVQTVVQRLDHQQTQ